MDVSPDEQTQGEILDKEKFHDVYKLVEEDGLPYFARLNGRGEVELYLVFETVDAFSEQTRDAVSVEFKTYQNKLLAVIWTLTDPLQPLGFPLSFDIRAVDERFVALTILQQPFTTLHYLAYENGQMTHIYSEDVKSGEFITVIGSNGAGKSTMMNMISGGMIPDKGFQKGRVYPCRLTGNAAICKELDPSNVNVGTRVRFFSNQGRIFFQIIPQIVHNGAVLKPDLLCTLVRFKIVGRLGAGHELSDRCNPM